MSFKAVDWVLDHSQAEGSARLVLIVLAENADQDDGSCWPSVNTIARRARISTRSVQYALRQLVDMGELAIHAQAGGHADWRGDRRPNLYVLTAYLAARGATSAPRSPGTGCNPASNGVQPGAPTGCNPLHPNQEIEPPAEQAHAAHAHAQGELVGADEGTGFDRWWAGYPRKKDKARARRLFDARRREGASLGDLLRARDAYLAEHIDTDLRYLKHPATFLAKDGPWTEYLDCPDVAGDDPGSIAAQLARQSWGTTEGSTQDDERRVG